MKKNNKLYIRDTFTMSAEKTLHRTAFCLLIFALLIFLVFFVSMTSVYDNSIAYENLARRLQNAGIKI